MGNVLLKIYPFAGVLLDVDRADERLEESEEVLDAHLRSAAAALSLLRCGGGY